MYYLRKKSYEQIIPEIHKTNGEIVPECKYTIEDRAIYKHPRCSRFYRGTFTGLEEKYQEMRVYTCKTLQHIISLRKSVFDYSGEWFDVYDENGIAHGDWEKEGGE